MHHNWLLPAKKYKSEKLNMRLISFIINSLNPLGILLITKQNTRQYEIAHE